jgi:hypothetical protein
MYIYKCADSPIFQWHPEVEGLNQGKHINKEISCRNNHQPDLVWHGGNERQV